MIDTDDANIKVKEPSSTPRKHKVRRGTVIDQPYIYDWETKNLSFIQTANDLKRLGIQNNKFFLKLYDKSLQGVDPHASYISDEMVCKIITECIRNIWYFLREVVRIPDAGGPGKPYQLNRANLAFTWCYVNNIDNWVNIPRQIGKTQGILANLNHAFLFGTTSSHIALFNKDLDASKENLERLKDQRDLLPSYLQLKNVEVVDADGKVDKEIDNVCKIFNPLTKNKITVKSSARSQEHARKLGRGNTLPITYMDEAEYTDWIAEIVEAAGPAFTTASDNARANNAAYCRIFSSTPGDPDTNAGAQAEIILEGTYRWTEKFYDMDIDDVKEIIDRNSENGIVYIEYSYQELGRDEAWFRRVCKSVGNRPAAVRREILLQRLRSSDLSPFEEDDLLALQEMSKVLSPKEEYMINEFYKLDLYDKLDKTLPYIVGVDVSAGYGQDNSAVTIIHPYNLKIVGEFKSPLISTPNFMKFLFVLIRKFIPRGILCIERNNNGCSIIDGLLETVIAPNIYFDNSKHIGPVVDSKLDNKGFLVREAQRRKAHGVWTGKESRETMMGIMEQIVLENKQLITGKNVVDDMIKLELKKGKIQAAVGAHDDCVMSWLIGLFVYYYGKNLNRYGLVRGYKPPTEQEKRAAMTSNKVYRQTLAHMSPADAAYFKNAQTYDYNFYYEKMEKEKRKANRQMNALDERFGDRTIVEDISTNFSTIEDDINSDIDPSWLDMFDDLNDFDD